jgi:hypothetical protein
MSRGLYHASWFLPTGPKADMSPRRDNLVSEYADFGAFERLELVLRPGRPNVVCSVTLVESTSTAMTLPPKRSRCPTWRPLLADSFADRTVLPHQTP